MALAALLLNQSIFASVETVRERFDSFVEALKKFDQSAINFYGSDAEIIHLELSKDGLTRPNHLSGKQYQQILKKIWPMVRSNNDVWTFSDLEFDQKQDYVEITGKRYSHLRDATFPYVARFATNNEGKWVIIYEYLKTKELDQPTF